MGDKTGPLDRRNEAFVDWKRDAFRFQESTDPIYKSIPFFLLQSGGRSCGIFLDNKWRARTGLPMMRPSFLEFPGEAKDGHPIDLNAQGEFMWGPRYKPAEFADAENCGGTAQHIHITRHL